jgi:VCBS repeat-containing protein
MPPADDLEVVDDTADITASNVFFLDDADPGQDTSNLLFYALTDASTGMPGDLNSGTGMQILNATTQTLVGKFGSFVIMRLAGGQINWRYTLDVNDPDTNALTPSAPGMDRLKVIAYDTLAADGRNSGEYTVDITVRGNPNNDPTGTITANLARVGPTESVTLSNNIMDADGIPAAGQNGAPVYTVYYSDEVFADYNALNTSSNKTALTVSGNEFTMIPAAGGKNIYAVYTYTDNGTMVRTEENVFAHLGLHDIPGTAGQAFGITDIDEADGMTVKGLFDGADDADFYAFTVPAGNNNIVTFTPTAGTVRTLSVHTSSSGNQNSDAIMDENGNQLLATGSALTGELAAGDYFIKIVGNSGAYEFTYALTPAETFSVGSGASAINITAVVVDGTSGDDILNGTGAQEIILGKGGDDMITTNGDDLVAGGPGNDVITLGAGAETLVYRYESDPVGNPGMWAATDGNDTIGSQTGAGISGGFTRGTDKLVLADISGSTPIANLADLTSDTDRPFVRVLTSQVMDSSAGTNYTYITAVAIHFGATTTAVPVGGDIPSLKIYFDTSDVSNLLTYYTDPANPSSGVRSELGTLGTFTNTALIDYTFIDDLFGTNSLVVVAADDADTVGGLDIL